MLFPLKYWIELNLIFTSVAILGIRNSDILYLPYIHGWNSLNIISEQFTLWLDHIMTKQTDTMSEDLLFHDKTHWYYVWGLTISWQNRLIPCMGLDHFMTKHTDTMHGTWPFHFKADWYYAWDLTISWQNQLIPCMVLDHFMTKQTVLCLGIDYFMTKHTNSMSGGFMCNGQITTRTHDSMINTHVHGHFEIHVRF